MTGIRHDCKNENFVVKLSTIFRLDFQEIFQVLSDFQDVRFGIVGKINKIWNVSKMKNVGSCNNQTNSFKTKLLLTKIENIQNKSEFLQIKTLKHKNIS